MNIREEEIPDLIRSGKDKEVVQLFYKKVLPQVSNFIRKRSGTKEDAWDIFHDAVLLFYKQVAKRKFNEEKYKVYGYVYRLSVNLWINKVKRENRLVPLELEQQDRLPDNDPGFQEELVALKDENLLNSVFSGIGEKCVEILTYTIYNNLLIEDIMIRMGLNSEGAVKMQLKRCREKLVQKVKENPGLVDLLRK